MAICLFGVLCSVNQTLFQSNQTAPGIIASFEGDPVIANSQKVVQRGPSYYNYEEPSESPCPHIFQYKQENGDWIGEVKLNNLDIYKNVRLRVETTIQKSLHDQNTGTIKLTTSIQEALNNLLKHYSLIYHVIFPSQNPLPKLKGIYNNNVLICSGPGDIEPPFTTINYLADFNVVYPSVLQPSSALAPHPDPQHLSYPELQEVPHPLTYPELHPETQPLFYPQQVTIKPLNIESEHDVNTEALENIACGTPVLGLTQSLVFGGKAVSRGQWPWLVAFYKAGRGNLEFICGGSLVSKSHVITAAHCIQDKQSNTIREAETGVVYVGKHNLDNWNEQGSQKRRVQRFIVNDEWQPFDVKYDADIAIIVMDTPVEYSQYVRPICIWEFSDNLNDVVGQRGILAGWGLNEHNNLNSEFPKTIEVPIVSEGTCLRSHSAILATSSDRTFCAGGQNGEGPCSGDSGGGLLLKQGDKWYLRGLVSTAPRDGSNPCDTKSFAVFTDVAKFGSWVRSNTQ